MRAITINGARLGLTGWGYRRRAALFQARRKHHEDGADAWNGGERPALGVARPPRLDPMLQGVHPSRRAGRLSGDARFQRATSRKASGPYHLTISDGERWSASAAYLRPIAGRAAEPQGHLQRARAHASLIESGKAVGVEYSPGRASRETSPREREVILCGGAFQSPQLLLLSGIGPQAHLRQHGVAVVADAPEVGRNLQDHLDVWPHLG